MSIEEKKITNIAKPESSKFPEKKVGVEELVDFKDSDMDYFKSLEGDDGWIAFGDDYYTNQQYFIVMGDDDEKLGIVGTYDTEDTKNITHVVVDPKYRRQGLVQKFYNKFLEQTNLEFLTATIDRKNIASYKSHEKAGFKKVSDEKYEEMFDKYEYRFEKGSEI